MCYCKTFIWILLFNCRHKNIVCISLAKLLVIRTFSCNITFFSIFKCLTLYINNNFSMFRKNIIFMLSLPYVMLKLFVVFLSFIQYTTSIFLYIDVCIGGDQGVLNTYFRNWNQLSYMYNVQATSNSPSWYTYSPAFNRYMFIIYIYIYILKLKILLLGFQRSVQY